MSDSFNSVINSNSVEQANSANDWWREAVIYQVYPRSFFDTDGDGVGDLAGITAKLDYIAGLGVDIVWISPFFTSPMRDFGYDVADYCNVDPLFGSLADFDLLIARAHQFGLKIMIDQVLSHSSDQHPWFIESRQSRDNPKSDWYVWTDPQPDGTPPNNWLSIFGGSAWQWDSRRRQYYFHNFLTSQPDLNFHQPQVQQAHLDNMQFWLERGVDGFRIDACIFHFHDEQLRNNPPAKIQNTVSVAASNPYGLQAHIYDNTRPENLQFFKRVRTLLNKYNAISIGEIGSDEALSTMAAYTADGDKLHMAYSFNLLTSDNTTQHISAQVDEFQAKANASPLPGWASWSIGNHDVNRVMSRWGDATTTTEFAKVLLAMQLVLKGTPCLYQGDELALTEADLPYEVLQDPVGLTFWPEMKGRDGCRTPIPWDGAQKNAGFSSGCAWLPVPPEHAAAAVAQQSLDPASPLNFARHFIHWRKTIKQLTRGDIFFYDSPEPLLALRRDLDGMPSVIVVLNLGSQKINFNLPDCSTYQALEGHGFVGSMVDGEISLPAYGAWFGVQKQA
ncbi:alpha-amylase family glycosyl hydrolase [Solimicrobium silvestre]|uniref:Glycosidase n=1 Tax=Solimicrobium silvestre TaxID=2099400 RepID=A0A2S9H5B9_9BURK|nr:alpha-amylase family glycosyl hydrolase [Solimicrobium silvestre]PRC95185.1 Glycosidase [Solimicrobium silvestre]